MVPWWLSVIVLVCIQQVIARDCSSLAKITNCNECARCGGVWCNVPHMSRHCGDALDDNWCPNNRELLPRGPSLEEPGDLLNPALVQNTVLVGDIELVKINFIQPTKSSKPQVSVSFVNSTVTNAEASFDVQVRPTECSHGKCTASILGKPLANFCPSNGSMAEFVTIRVKVSGMMDEAVVQYQVPCACACSQAVERFSQKCNLQGDLACGACSCRAGWVGEYCKLEDATTPPPAITECKDDRGDVPDECKRPARAECSGNGICHCRRCECFPDRPYYQYFNSFCEDICTVTSWCDDCLFHPTPGICQDCNQESIIIENTTVVPAGDAWVQCNETRGDCMVRYAAMRDDNNDVRIIVLNSCDAVEAVVAGPVNITVPIVVGIIAVLAAAAAVTGFMVWKNRTPPLPLSDPQYTNIGAEDCTGINPLYKPPTSSFKNPTYGKC